MMHRHGPVRDAAGPAGRPLGRLERHRRRRRGAVPSRSYRPALDRLPSGRRRSSAACPFELAAAVGGPALDPPRATACRSTSAAKPADGRRHGAGPASHLVVAHFSDSWREPTASGRRACRSAGSFRPASRSRRYEVIGADGRSRSIEIRRRFEIADGIIGWGFLPFEAVGHRADEPVDWRGPHPRQIGRPLRAGRPRRAARRCCRAAWAAGPDRRRRLRPDAPTTTSPCGSTRSPSLQGERPGRRSGSRRSAAAGPGDAVVVAGVDLLPRRPPARSWPAPPRRSCVERRGTACRPSTSGCSIRSRPLPRPAAPAEASSAGEPLGWGRPRADRGPRSGSVTCPRRRGRHGRRPRRDARRPPSAR